MFGASEKGDLGGKGICTYRRKLPDVEAEKQMAIV